MSAPARLRSADVAEQLAAIAEIADRGVRDARELNALAQCLGDQRKVIQRRAAEAFAALTEQGVDVQAVLRNLLQSNTARHRWGAAYALSLMGTTPPVALPVLLEALGCDDGDVRWAAGNILVRMRGYGGLAAALCELLTTGSPAQRKMAAYCLRDLETRSPEIEQAVLAAVRDADAGVQLAAVSCLARLAMDRTAAAHCLIELLGDPHASVRRVAAVALGLVGDRSEKVLAALHGARASTDLSLQRAAERALRLLKAGPPGAPHTTAPGAASG
jgi:HEAT repeat protein